MTSSTTTGSTDTGSTNTTTSTGADPATTREQQDLLDTLAKHRGFLQFTMRDLTDDQARLTPTASVLCLGGLIKHVTAMEEAWVDFVLGKRDGMEFTGDPAQFEAHAAQFKMLPDDTLEAILADYDRVARRTDDVIRATPDFGVSQALPEAPWFEPGAEWSHRRVFLHVIAETSQHAGHADIIRETIDGSRTMG